MQKTALNVLCLQGIKLCNNMGCGAGAGLLLFPSVSLVSKVYSDSLTNLFLRELTEVEVFGLSDCILLRFLILTLWLALVT